MDSKRLEQLGRTATALKGWKWMAGMQYALPVSSRFVNHHFPYSPERINGFDGGSWTVPGYIGDYYTPAGVELPVVTDAATAGCLLSLLSDRDAASAVRGYEDGVFDSIGEACVAVADAAGGWRPRLTPSMVP